MAIFLGDFIGLESLTPYIVFITHFITHFRDLKTGESIRRWGQGEYIHQQSEDITYSIFLYYSILFSLLSSLYLPKIVYFHSLLPN